MAPATMHLCEELRGGRPQDVRVPMRARPRLRRPSLVAALSLSRPASTASPALGSRAQAPATAPLVTVEQRVPAVGLEWANEVTTPRRGRMEHRGDVGDLLDGFNCQQVSGGGSLKSGVQIGSLPFTRLSLNEGPRFSDTLTNRDTHTQSRASANSGSPLNRSLSPRRSPATSPSRLSPSFLDGTGSSMMNGPVLLVEVCSDIHSLVATQVRRILSVFGPRGNHISGFALQNKDLEVLLEWPTQEETTMLAGTFPAIGVRVLPRMCGLGPISTCCRLPAHVGLHIAMGVVVTCSSPTCASPSLIREALPETVRKTLWCRWATCGTLPPQVPMVGESSSMPTEVLDMPSKGLALVPGCRVQGITSFPCVKSLDEGFQFSTEQNFRPLNLFRYKVRSGTSQCASAKLASIWASTSATEQSDACSVLEETSHNFCQWDAPPTSIDSAEPSSDLSCSLKGGPASVADVPIFESPPVLRLSGKKNWGPVTLPSTASTIDGLTSKQTANPPRTTKVAARLTRTPSKEYPETSLPISSSPSQQAAEDLPDTPSMNSRRPAPSPIRMFSPNLGLAFPNDFQESSFPKSPSPKHQMANWLPESKLSDSIRAHGEAPKTPFDTTRWQATPGSEISLAASAHEPSFPKSRSLNCQFAGRLPESKLWDSSRALGEVPTTPFDTTSWQAKLGSGITMATSAQEPPFPKSRSPNYQFASKLLESKLLDSAKARAEAPTTPQEHGESSEWVPSLPEHPSHRSPAALRRGPWLRAKAEPKRAQSKESKSDRFGSVNLGIVSLSKQRTLKGQVDEHTTAEELRSKRHLISTSTGEDGGYSWLDSTEDRGEAEDSTTLDHQGGLQHGASVPHHINRELVSLALAQSRSQSKTVVFHDQQVEGGEVASDITIPSDEQHQGEPKQKCKKAATFDENVHEQVEFETDSSEEISDEEHFEQKPAAKVDLWQQLSIYANLQTHMQTDSKGKRVLMMQKEEDEGKGKLKKKDRCAARKMKQEKKNIASRLRKDSLLGSEGKRIKSAVDPASIFGKANSNSRESATNKKRPKKAALSPLSNPSSDNAKSRASRKTTMRGTDEKVIDESRDAPDHHAYNKEVLQRWEEVVQNLKERQPYILSCRDVLERLHQRLIDDPFMENKVEDGKGVGVVSTWNSLWRSLYNAEKAPAEKLASSDVDEEEVEEVEEDEEDEDVHLDAQLTVICCFEVENLKYRKLLSNVAAQHTLRSGVTRIFSHRFKSYISKLLVDNSRLAELQSRALAAATEVNIFSGFGAVGIEVKVGPISKQRALVVRDALLYSQLQCLAALTRFINNDPSLSTFLVSVAKKAGVTLTRSPVMIDSEGLERDSETESEACDSSGSELEDGHSDGRLTDTGEGAAHLSRRLSGMEKRSSRLSQVTSLLSQNRRLGFESNLQQLLGDGTPNRISSPPVGVSPSTSRKPSIEGIEQRFEDVVGWTEPVSPPGRGSEADEDDVLLRTASRSPSPMLMCAPQHAVEDVRTNSPSASNRSSAELQLLASHQGIWHSQDVGVSRTSEKFEQVTAGPGNFDLGYWDVSIDAPSSWAKTSEAESWAVRSLQLRKGSIGAGPPRPLPQPVPSRWTTRFGRKQWYHVAQKLGDGFSALVLPKGATERATRHIRGRALPRMAPTITDPSASYNQ